MNRATSIGTTISRLARSFWAVAARHPVAVEVVLAPVAIGIVYSLTYGRMMGSGLMTATFGDNTHTFLPLFNHVSQTFARGEYPYWVNSILGGMRLYDTPQFAIEYPFYFFRWHLFGNPVDAMFAAENIIRLHVFIAYITTYVLLRVLRISVAAAFMGASIFVISPNMYFYTFGVTLIAPYAWFPLVIASAYLIIENLHPRTGALLGAFSLALLIMASPSQPLIHAVYVMGILYVWAIVVRWRNADLRALIPITANFAAMGGTAFILASPVLVPLLLHAGEAIRFVGDFAPVYGFDRVPIEAAVVQQFPVADFAGAFWPFAATYSHDMFFVGVSAVGLALFGLFTARSRWIVFPVAFTAVYALLASAGTNLWLGYVTYHLPLMDKIREPERHLMLFVLGISILAGLGFDYLAEQLRGGRRFHLTWLHGIVAIVTVGGASAALLTPHIYVGTIGPPALAGLFALPFLLLLLLPYCRVPAARFGVAGLAALSLVFANTHYPWSAPRLQDGDYFAAPNLVSHKVLARLAQIPDIAQYRLIVKDDVLGGAFWSMNGIYYGVRSVQAYMNPMPSALQFDQDFQRFNLRHYYPLLGAKYYLCRPCDKLLLRDYTYERSIEGLKLYVAGEALPRYAIIDAVAGSFEGGDEFYAKIDAGFDFRRRAYLGVADAGPVSAWLGTHGSQSSHIVKEEHSSANRLEVTINMSERGIFLLNEYHSKDWQAKVNGTPAPVFNINLNQMGVLLDKGANIVEFEYFPKLYVALLLLQRITFVVLVLYVLWLARARLIRRLGREAVTAL